MGVANNGINSENSDGGVTGKGFQPGQSGNPSGRPKGAKGFRDRCREFADDKGLPVLIDIAESAKHKDRMKAVELLLAYGYGKPKQGVELSGDDGGDIKIIIERI